jgi:hypothetical protein
VGLLPAVVAMGIFLLAVAAEQVPQEQTPQQLLLLLKAVMEEQERLRLFLVRQLPMQVVVAVRQEVLELPERAELVGVGTVVKEIRHQQPLDL